MIKLSISSDDDTIKKLNCYLENEDTLCVKFDASTFYEDRSGIIEVRFSTPLARTFLEIIEQNAA